MDSAGAAVTDEIDPGEALEPTAVFNSSRNCSTCSNVIVCCGNDCRGLLEIWLCAAVGAFWCTMRVLLDAGEAATDVAWDNCVAGLFGGASR